MGCIKNLFVDLFVETVTPMHSTVRTTWKSDSIDTSCYVSVLIMAAHVGTHICNISSFVVKEWL